jgi:hypothetical protein
MWRRTAVCLAFLALALPGGAAAHDIPNDVVVQSFLQPAGKQLNLIVRVPLSALRDITFPEHPSGYLDLQRVEALLPDAASLWISDFIDVYENEARLPRPRVERTRISLPSDRSFAAFENAAALLDGPKLPLDTNIVWNQAMLDVWFAYPIESDRSKFSIDPRLARLGLRVVSTLRFRPPDGPERAFEFDENPGLIHLDPRWYQAALQFAGLGFRHILEGTDHLLFLLALVIPFRRLWALVPIVTSFTVAHSITLIASAYNLAPGALWFPPLVEALIAASIVYMALENITGKANVHRRWIVAFAFGLVHGFGFSFALRETLQFAGSHLLTSLLSFNVGVELGQLLVLAVLVPTLDALFRWVVAERMGTIIVSTFVAHTGWHWLLERTDRLRQFRFQWPVFTAAQLAGLLGWAIALVFLAGLIWVVSLVMEQRRGQAGNQLARESE